MAIVDELVAILGYDVKGQAEAKRFERTIDGLNNRLNRLATVAAGAAAALGVMAGFFGRSVFNTSAMFEKFETSLTTIEGTAEKARESMKWIEEFTAKTPFELAQVTDSFIKLKAYGIDPVANNALRILGDTASAMGKTLDQAVEAFADAATGEFERLKEFGIKASSKGDEVTFRWTENGKELTKTVKKNSEEIRAFLLETMGARFAGAMDRQSKTALGMLSNISDRWTDFKKRIGEAGFFDAVKDQMSGLLAQIDRLDKEGKLDEWAAGISKALEFALSVVVAIAEQTAHHVGFLIENYDNLEPVIYAIGIAFGFLMVRAMPVISAFVALALVVDDFLSYLQGGESVIGSFIDKMSEFTGLPDVVSQAMAGVLAAWAVAFLIRPKTILAASVGLFRGAIAKIAAVVTAGLIALAPKVGALIVGLFNPVGAVAAVAVVAAALVAAYWGEIVAAFNGLNLAEQGAALGRTLLDGLKGIGVSIRDWFAGLIPDWAKDWFSSGAPKTPPAAEPNPVPEAFRDPNAISNAQKYLEKMSTPGAAAASAKDRGGVDSRDQSVVNNVTVNQSVTQATNAPSAAASATGRAVARSLTEQRVQVETEPAL